MIRERKSSSTLLLEEIDSVSGDRCASSCDHHDYIMNKEWNTASCQRAKDHVGAVTMTDVHVYVLIDDDGRHPIVFTEHCCAREEAA